jgi:hypothetical protein
MLLTDRLIGLKIKNWELIYELMFKSTCSKWRDMSSAAAFD